MKLLRAYGIPEAIVRLIEGIYTGAKAEAVTADGITEIFDILAQCCTPPYFKKLGGVFPKYAAAAAYAGVESSELFQIFVPCTRFAILYIFVKSKFWQLIRTIFNVLDNRFMIIVSKTFSLK